MDQRLQKALEFSNFMISLDNQTRNLQNKFYQDTIFYYNGGQFKITQELISFCKTMIDYNQTSLVIVDDNDLPVQIENLNKFVNDIINVYVESSKSFLNDYNILRKERSVEFIISQS